MNENKAFIQNSFSRSLINDYKLGAYYTDIEHCKRIGNLFEFPENEEVCVLEPSIGDGSAVLAVTGQGRKKDNIVIFGVELNGKTYERIKDDQRFDYVVNADFLNGVKISNGSFSFCFANPPYGTLPDSKERLETKFIEKMYHYLRGGGMTAIVIPFYVLKDDSFLKVFFARFNVLATFKFDDDVYAQFQQIVVIAQKRQNGIGYMKNWLIKYKESIDKLDMLPYLPKLDDYIEKRIPVSPSQEKNVEYFTTLAFDAKAAGESLKESALYQALSHKYCVPEYSATDIGRPPVPLSRDLIYLCAVSGGGQGLVGSSENNDLHLQRGVAKVVKEVEIKENEKGTTELIEKTFTKICINIIENDGTITVLE